MSATVIAPSTRDTSRGEKRAFAYIEWRLACIAVWTAYREWTRAMRADAALAHVAYEAALDREDAAASVYSGLMRLTCGPTGEPGHSRSADQANHTIREPGRR